MSYADDLEKALSMAHGIPHAFTRKGSSGGREAYVDQPPDATTLSMWIKSRSGLTLTDEYGNDATILTPTFRKDSGGSAQILGVSSRASEKIFDGGSYTYYFKFKQVSDVIGAGAADLVGFGGGKVAARRGMELESYNGNLWIYIADGVTAYSKNLVTDMNTNMKGSFFEFYITITTATAYCRIYKDDVPFGNEFNQDITAFNFNNNNNYAGWVFNSEEAIVGNVKKFSGIKTLAQCQADSYNTDLQIHLENVFSGADISGNQQDFSHSNVTVDDLYYDNISSWCMDHGYDAFESALDDDFKRIIGRRTDGTVNTPSRAPGTSWASSRIVFASQSGMMNLIDCKIRFTNTFFDRSDTTIWKAAARTGYYDASDPLTFHVTELNQKTLYDWLNTGYLGRAYVKFTDNSIEPRDRKVMESIFLYTTDRTGSDMTSVLTYTGDMFAVVQDGGFAPTYDSGGYAKMGTLKSATAMLSFREDDGFEDLLTIWRPYFQPYDIQVNFSIHSAEVGGNQDGSPYADWDQIKQMYNTPVRYAVGCHNNYDNDYSTLSLYDTMGDDMLAGKTTQEAQGIPCRYYVGNRHSSSNPSTPYYAHKLGFMGHFAWNVYGKGGVPGPNPREVDLFRVCAMSIDLNAPVGNPYNLNVTPNTTQVQNIKDQMDICVSEKRWMVLFFHTYNERVKDGLLEVVLYARSIGLGEYSFEDAIRNCKYL